MDLRVTTAFILMVAFMAGLRHGNGFTSASLPDNINAGFQFVGERRIQTALLFGADMYIKRVVNRQSRYPSANQRTMSTYLLLALLISGDIQLNPGPVKYPCGVCKKAVARNHRAMCCDECDTWIHIGCCGVSPKEYRHLQHSNVSWYCTHCSLPNFSNSFFNDSSILSDPNPYDLLSDSVSENGDNIADSESEPTNRNKPTNKPKSKPIKIMVINCNSILSTDKRTQFMSTVEAEGPDVVIGTESHVDASVSDGEIFHPGYDVYRKDRDRNGGGVFVAIKNCFISSGMPEFDSDCETVWARIQVFGCRTLIVGSYYRPPNSTIDALSGLEDSLGRISSKYPAANIVLGGDFNMPGIDWETKSVIRNPQYGNGMSQKLIDICNDFSLDQVVRIPTRLNNILDLILTTNPNLFRNISTINGISDHDIVTTDLDMKVPMNKKKARTVYIYKRANIGAIKKELDEFNINLFGEDFNLRSVNENWNMFKLIVLDSMNRFIPTKKLSTRNNLPWMTRHIHRLIRKKQRLYNKAKKTQNNQDWAVFRKLRTHVKTELTAAYHNYIDSMLDVECNEERSIPKKFWSYVKNIRKDFVGIPSLKDHNNHLVSSSKGKADILSKQYQTVFTKEDLVNIPVMPQSPYSAMPGITVTVHGVHKLLLRLKPGKAHGPDAIPNKILMETADQIAPCLARIFQQSIDTGEVPLDWKHANISAVFKKGDKSIAANYRPVSLTSVCCKLFEHIIYSNIMDHLDSNNIIVEYQHGFRNKHSCETQLIGATEDIAKNIDNGHQTDLLILDFSKAFDTVPHARLMGKLQYYGVSDGVTNWISNWLTDRKQNVVVDGESSEEVTVESGVPQGTVLGPLLFLLYVNDIGEGITSNIRLFADDCILYRCINDSNDVEALQSDLHRLVDWSATWQMHFNINKCSVMHITKKRTIHRSQYTINGDSLGTVHHHPYLGVEFSDDLRWNTHISHLSAKSNRILGFIKRNLYKCSEKTKQSAYFALVRPNLEYASAAWDPYTKKNINELEKIQRRAARFVMGNNSRESSVTLMMKTLKWESLEHRREVSRLAMFYKSVHGEIALPLPSHLVHSINNTRGHSERFIQVPARTQVYANSFFNRTVRNWNGLTETVVSAATVDTFKSRLGRRL